MTSVPCKPDHDGLTDWMGQLPTNWGTAPVANHFDIQLGKMLQNKQVTDEDMSVPYLKAAHVQWGSVRSEGIPEMFASPSDLRKYDVGPGDLLVCEGGEVGRASLVDIVPTPCIIQNSLHRVRAKGDNSLLYLRYVLEAMRNSGWIDVLCNKATIAHFTREKFASARIPIPPTPAEQLRIARYLDARSQQIDSVIQSKQKQIELIQERNSAIVDETVMTGLDRNRPLRNSEVEWIGEIPIGWEVMRARRIFTEVDQRSRTGSEELLTVSHLTGVTRRSEKNVNMFMAQTLEGYKKCRKGDLVINTMWAWMGALGVARQDGVVSPSYNVYRFRDDGCLPLYYDHLFRTRRFATEMKRYSKGVWESRLRLYPEEFLQIYLPHPPRGEQEEIARHLESEVEHVRSLTSQIQESIKELVEYRAATIYAVVTGKMNFREVT